jgi:hypothetical protein
MRRVVALVVVLGLFGPQSAIGSISIGEILEKLIPGSSSGVTQALHIPLSQPIRTLVDGTVATVTKAVDDLVLSGDPTQIVTDPVGTLSSLRPLEPADGVIEDVAHPDVLEPSSAAVGPIADAVQPVTRPFAPVVDTADAGAHAALVSVVKAASLDPAAYVVRSTFRAPNGTETVRLADAVVEEPRAIDLDGSGVPDVTVELRFITARPSLRVSRLPSADADSLAAVEAITAPGGWDAPSRLAIGVDGRERGLPEVVRATLADDGQQSGKLSAVIHSVDPRGQLAITAVVYDEVNNAAVDPQTVRASFAPMPEDITIGATAPGGDVLGGGVVSLDMSEPSLVDVAYTAAHGADSTAVGALFDRAPRHLSLGIAEGAGNGFGITYAATAAVDNIVLHAAETTGGITRTVALGVEGIDAHTASINVSPNDGLFGIEASEPIDAITLEVVDPRGLFDRATTLRARLEGLPADLTGAIDDNGGLSLSAGDGVLGLLEFQLTSGPDASLLPSTDGFLLRDDPSQFVAFARVTNLKSMALNADPLGATLRTAGDRPFVVDVAQTTASEATTAILNIDALPSQLSLSLDGNNAVDYEASRTIDSFTASLTRTPTGGTPLAIDLDVTDFPKQLQATLNDNGFTWEASSVVPRFVATITDPGGVADRVTSIGIEIDDLPEQLSVGLDSGGFSLDAAHGAIGNLVLSATSGAPLAPAAGEEGVVIVDRPDFFGVGVRLSDLEGASFTPDPMALSLHSGHARRFVLQAQQDDGAGNTRSFDGVIDQLPEDVTIGVANTGDAFGLEYTASDIAASFVASLTQSGANALSAVINIADLPKDVSAVVAPDGALDWTASSDVPLLVAELTNPAGIVSGASHLLVRITDLPQRLTASATGNDVSFAAGAGQHVGLLELQLDNGAPVQLTDDGVYLRDTAGALLASVRITGLRSLGLDPATGALSLGTLGGQPFAIDLARDDADGNHFDVRADLHNLPADVSVGLASGGGLGLQYTASEVMDELLATVHTQAPAADPVTMNLRIEDIPTALNVNVDDAGAVQYSAAAVVPVLELDAVDPAGFFGRATNLHVLANDLPTALSATVGDDGTLSILAPNEAVGSLVAEFNDGNPVTLAGTDDGVAVLDTPDQFAVAARITGLRELGLTPEAGGTTLTLGTTGGRVFHALVNQNDPTAGTATTIDATLDSLPDTVSIGLVQGDTGRSLAYDASSRMDNLFASVGLTTVDGTTNFVLDMDNLPTEVNLGLLDSGGIDYSASGRADKLAVTVDDPAGIFAAATHLQAELTDLPTALSVVLGEDGTLALDAPDRLGLLEALATTGSTTGLDPDVDGIRLVDDGTDFLAFFRVTDLRHVALNPNPVSLTVASDAHRQFVIDGQLSSTGVLAATDGDLDLGATFANLPDTMTLGFGLSGDSQAISLGSSASIADVAFDLLQHGADGSSLDVSLVMQDTPTQLDMAIDPTGAINYTASGRMPLLALDAFDPAGLFDRAGTLKLRLQDIPTQLNVALSDTGAVTIDGHNARLGLMEAQATTGPNDQLAANQDGVLMKDLPDRFVVFARFTNLYSATVTQTPLPAVNLRTDGGRPLSISLYTSNPGKLGPNPNQDYTVATLTPMPSTVNLALLPGDPGSLNVQYSANSNATSLTFESNSGDRWVTRISIANPVPLSFTGCQAADNKCGGSGRSPSNVGSFRFIANQHTTLNVWDCVRPLTTRCNTPITSSQDADRFTSVTNLLVKTLTFDGNAVPNSTNTGASGYLWIDTVPPGLPKTTLNNADTMSGQIKNKSSQQMTLTFGTNFKAANRLSTFNNYPINIFSPPVKTGLVSCTSGTGVTVTVWLLGIPLNISANSLLC